MPWRWAHWWKFWIVCRREAERKSQAFHAAKHPSYWVIQTGSAVSTDTIWETWFDRRRYFCQWCDKRNRINFAGRCHSNDQWAWRRGAHCTINQKSRQRPEGAAKLRRQYGRTGIRQHLCKWLWYVPDGDLWFRFRVKYQFDAPI